SFPTRRSSDLIQSGWSDEVGQRVDVRGVDLVVGLVALEDDLLDLVDLLVDPVGLLLPLGRGLLARDRGLALPAGARGVEGLLDLADGGLDAVDGLQELVDDRGRLAGVITGLTGHCSPSHSGVACCAAFALRRIRRRALGPPACRTRASTFPRAVCRPEPRSPRRRGGRNPV